MTISFKYKISKVIIVGILFASILGLVTAFYLGRDIGEENVMYPILKVMGGVEGFSRIKGAGKEVIIFSDKKGAAYIVNPPFTIAGAGADTQQGENQ